MAPEDVQLSRADEMVLSEFDDLTIRGLMRQIYVACKQCDDKGHAEVTSRQALRLATGFPADYPPWGGDKPSGFSPEKIAAELGALYRERFPELQK